MIASEAMVTGPYDLKVLGGLANWDATQLSAHLTAGGRRVLRTADDRRAKCQNGSRSLWVRRSRSKCVSVRHRLEELLPG